MANSEELQTLLKNSLLNNSYDWDSMHAQLKRTWMRSFSYLYSLQKSYINYDELIYYTSDETGHDQTIVGQLYLDKSLHARFNIEKDFIHPEARKAFRSSDFYQNTFTIEDVMDNPNIFLRMPIVIIDDQVIWDYEIYANGDRTTFILPFTRSFVLEAERNPSTDDVVYIDHKIEVLMIDTAFYERLKATIGSNVTFDRTTNQIVIPKTLFTRSIPKKSGIMMMSIHIPNSYGNTYELGSEMVVLTDTGDAYSAILDDELASALKIASPNIYISCFFIRHLNTHTMYDRSDIVIEAGYNYAPLFVLEDSYRHHYDNPIPVENMIVLKKGSDEEKFTLIKNTNAIKMYYPNIYEIIDPDMEYGDLYKVLYFYYEGSTDLRYTYLFDFFYAYLYRLFPNITTEQIVNILHRQWGYSAAEYYDRLTSKQKEKLYERFETTMNYVWYEHEYTENDFITKYLPTPGNENKIGVQFQDETLKEWIKVEPHVLNEYVLSQKKLGTTYYLYTKELDLASKLRQDTSQEFPNTYITFDEDRYLFAIANDDYNNRPMHIRLFCDGLFVEDIYHRRKNYMELLYVPASAITADSYLEMEILPDYSYSTEVTFESTEDSKEIVLDEPEDVVFPTLADYYATEEVIDPNGETYERRYGNEWFHFTEHYSRGDFEVEASDAAHPVEFTRMKNHSVTADAAVTGHTINMTITKSPHLFTYKTKRDGYVYLEFVTGEHEWNFNINYIRVFVNGRLYPREWMMFQRQLSNPRLFFYKTFTSGTLITIDISPYQYKQLYYAKDIYTASEVKKVYTSFSTDSTSVNDIFVQYVEGSIDPPTEDDEPESISSILVDLSSVINKPFDARYYDIYMNGKRLSLNNVFPVSPYMVRLVNLTSSHNMLIFEKERDYEWYGLDYTKPIYPYTINEMLTDIFMSKTTRTWVIDDIISKLKDSRLTINENTDDEEYEYYELDPNVVYAIQVMFFYYDELVARRFAFGDHIQYLEEVLKTYYKGVYVNYFTKTANHAWDAESKQRQANYPGVVFMDAEVVVEGDYSGGGKYIDDDTNDASSNDDEPLYVYTIGHPGDVSEDLLEQEIYIPTDPKHKLPVT